MIRGLSSDWLLWIARQLFSRTLTLWLVTCLVFALARLAPGNPWQIENWGSPANIASPPDSSASQDGLKSAVLDYLNWAGAVASLNLGHSLRDGSPVSSKIWQRFRITLLLNTVALAIIYTIAIPLGIFAASAAAKPLGRRLDRLFSLLYSLPAFWVALILMVFLCGGDYWHLFPVTGLRSAATGDARSLPLFFDVSWHLVLPVFCLSYAGVGYVARQVRSAALECLHSEFILLARAKGLRRRTIFSRHVLPHATLPGMALLTQFFPALLGGSVLIETIFSIPGMGQLSVESVLARDYPVLMAIGLLSALATLVGGLLVEGYLRFRREGWDAA